MLAVIVVWDVLAAMTAGDSLTGTFRRGVTATAWRWPVLILILLVVGHLYMPPRLRQYDPLDRVYERTEKLFNPKQFKHQQRPRPQPRKARISVPAGPVR